MTKENGRAGQRDVLTLEQAAALLQMHQHTVVRLAQEGAIPGRKLGRQWRFSRRALLEALEQQAKTGSEEQHEVEQAVDQSRRAQGSASRRTIAT